MGAWERNGRKDCLSPNLNNNAQASNRPLIIELGRAVLFPWGGRKPDGSLPGGRGGGKCCGVVLGKPH